MNDQTTKKKIKITKTSKYAHPMKSPRENPKKKNPPVRSSSALVRMVTSSSDRQASTNARCSDTALGWDRIRLTNPTSPYDGGSDGGGGGCGKKAGMTTGGGSGGRARAGVTEVR